MKSISTIDPAITENMEIMIVKPYATVIDIRVDVSPQHGVSCLFQALSNIWLTFPAKNNLRSALACTARI